MNFDVMEKSCAHKIEIDPGELLSQLQAMEVAEINARTKFSHHEMLELVYEDLVRDREAEMKKVATFLGIRYQSVSSRLLKLSPQKLSDSVTNYEDLKNALFETRWSEYLDG